MGGLRAASVKVLYFRTSIERIARMASCIEPYCSLQMHAKPELTHRL